MGEMMTEPEPMASVGTFARWRSSQPPARAAITAAVTRETRRADLREGGAGGMGAVGRGWKRDAVDSNAKRRGRNPRAAGRRRGADHRKSRVAHGDSGFQFVGDAGLAAGETGGTAGVVNGQHEAGAVDAGEAGRAEPNEGQVVRRGELGSVEAAAEGRIGAGFAHVVDRG